jgi:hypothetical protein
MDSVIHSMSSQVAEGKNLKEIIGNIIDHLALIVKHKVFSVHQIIIFIKKNKKSSFALGYLPIHTFKGIP